MELLKSVTGI